MPWPDLDDDERSARRHWLKGTEALACKDDRLAAQKYAVCVDLCPGNEMYEARLRGTDAIAQRASLS